MHEPPSIATTEVLLEKVRLAAQRTLSPQVAHDLELRELQDFQNHLTEGLVYELRTFILKLRLERQEYRIVVSRPATWWDHLKLELLRWAYEQGFHEWPRWRVGNLLGRWVLHRHPIRETFEVRTISFDEAAALFPDNEWVMPKELGPAVIVTRQGGVPFP